MKKFITMGLFVAAVFGGSFSVQAEEACCPLDGAKTEEGISIGKGFEKIWHETGIYRFINPKTSEEKKTEKLAAAIKARQS